MRLLIDKPYIPASRNIHTSVTISSIVLCPIPSTGGIIPVSRSSFPLSVQHVVGVVAARHSPLYLYDARATSSHVNVPDTLRDYPTLCYGPK